MKKILSLALVVVLLLTAVGGTLAYFTDTDAQVNTFVVGNVAIDLYEEFGDGDGIETLIPSTGSAQDGTLKNGIDKKVYVQNTGSEEAFVRVHIAIPAALDNGAELFDASQNVLHFNFSKDSVAEGKWDWSKTVDDGVTTGNWNYYETDIDGIKYNVYVVTYTTALLEGETTLDAIHQVYLDSSVTNEQVTALKNALGGYWHIKVVAEATQADGFNDAYEALNTSFGAVGTYAPDFDAESEGWTFR